MIVLDPDLVEVDPAPLREIEITLKSVYRMLIFSPRYSDDDLLRRFLSSSHSLTDVVAMKNAQMEAQTLEEARGYLAHLRDAFEFITEEIVQDRTFEGAIDLFALFRHVAPEVHAQHPNRFRDRLVQVGAHVCPEPGEVPYRIESFFHHLRRIRDPVIRAIYAHHELVRIHPFSDGNGRVSRMAKNWILMHELHPPVFITSSEREPYLRNLARSFDALAREPRTFSDASRAFFTQEVERLHRSVKLLREDVARHARSGADASSP